jgi:hypothetical protein
VSVYEGGGASASQVGALTRPPFITGRTYPLYPDAGTAASAFATANRLTLVQWWPERDALVTSLGLHVTVLGTSPEMKVGIWLANQATLDPTGLAVTSNNAFTIAGTGDNMATVAGYTVRKGLFYYVGWMTTGGSTFVRFAQATYSPGALTGTSGGGTTPNAGRRPTSEPTYATDIATIDLTGVALTELTAAATPHMLFGV